MFYSSCNVFFKAVETTSPPKLFPSDSITLYGRTIDIFTLWAERTKMLDTNINVQEEELYVMLLMYIKGKL